MAAEEALEAVEARGSAAPDALREVAVDDRADRAETPAGIFARFRSPADTGVPFFSRQFVWGRKRGGLSAYCRCVLSMLFVESADIKLAWRCGFVDSAPVNKLPLWDGFCFVAYMYPWTPHPWTRPVRRYIWIHVCTYENVLTPVQ